MSTLPHLASASCSTEPNNSYGYRNGTSMAAPHVSGVAALVFSTHPDASVAEVKNALLQGADQASSLQNKVSNSRRLNAFGALNAATFAPRATLVEAQSIYAASTSLVRDIGTAGEGSDPQRFIQAGGITYFVARSVEYGHELWKTDGTTAGTVLVRDILQGGDGSEINYLTNVNGTLFFIAKDGAHGQELWKSDGTSFGTVVVRDIHPGAESTGLGGLANFNERLFFQVFNDVLGYRLWTSDGTELGTVPIPTPLTITGYVGPAIDGVVYFVADDGLSGYELWRSDGTADGTQLVSDIRPGIDGSRPSYLASLDGELLFTARDGVIGYELWKTDGTSSGTVLVFDINPGEQGSNIKDLYVGEGIIYFVATDPASGEELWVTDGTSSGTRLLRDIAVGEASSNPGPLTFRDGYVYFSASDGINGHTLWQSDGTSSGTVLAIDPGLVGQTITNGRFIFIFDDGISGPSLWTSDGTSTGSTLLYDFRSDSENPNIDGFYVHDGRLFFRANDGVSGRELWVTDGTSSGTRLVRDINLGIAGSQPDNFNSIEDTLIFTATNSTFGYELWKTDGTSSGTILLRDINHKTTSSSPRYLTNVNGTLYFRLNTPSGPQLWTSDGTSAGTFATTGDIQTPGVSIDPQTQLTINNITYFRRMDEEFGSELWKTDGTSSGTMLVRDISPGNASSLPNELTWFNGYLYFAAADPANGRELWKSDGTCEGTMLVVDFNPGSGNGLGRSPFFTSDVIVDVGERLIIQANDGVHGNELWRSDGTSSGTFLVKDIAPGGSDGVTLAEGVNVNGVAYFEASGGPFGLEVWKSDGTCQGTSLVRDIKFGGAGGLQHLTYFTNVNGQLFFRADDGLSGMELWKSDDQNPSGTSTTFTLTFDGVAAVDPASIDTGDILVRRVGFPDYDGRVTEVVSTTMGSGGILTVTYRVSAPGVWDSTDNGVYQIVLQSGQVKDVNGLAAAEKVLGSFTVDISDPHVFYVNTTADTVDANPGDGLALDANGRTSLRAAIMEANAMPEYQTVMVPQGTYSLLRNGIGDDRAALGDLDITGDLFLVGAGNDHTIIDGGGLDRVLDIQPGTRVTLRDLTVRDGGNVDQGAGLRIRESTVTLDRVTITNNVANREGGGVYNDGTLSIVHSTISDNATLQSLGKGGGGLYNRRTVSIDSSTLANNISAGGALSTGGGGGIQNENSGTVTITNSTLSGNTASQGRGGGVNNAGATELIQSTVTANNSTTSLGGGLYNDDSPTTPTVFDQKFGANGPGPLEMNLPTGLTIATSGNILVGDAGFDRVQVFNSAGLYLSTFGTAGITAGKFNGPASLAYDSAGRLIVADRDNSRVQVFNTDGSFAFVINDSATAVATNSANQILVGLNGRVKVYNADGSLNHTLVSPPSGEGSFGVVSGLFVDSVGRQYIASAESRKVQVYSSADIYQTTLEPSGGDAANYTPEDVTVDVAGRINVTDSGNDGVQVFQANGDYFGRFGSLGSSNGQFNNPREIAIAADGALLVADSGNTRVQRLSTAGTFFSTFGNPPNSQSPRGVALDSLGRTIVADTENHRVQIFDVDGLLVTQFGSLGAGPGQFNAPQGVAIDGLNRILVADTGNHRVQVFDASGNFSLAIGSQGSGNSQFQSPTAVAAASDGRFVVADTGNHRIQVFNLFGGFQSAFGLQGTANTQFQSPQGIAFDGTSIFVADTGNHQIKRFSTTGSFQASFGSSGSGNGQFASPTSVAVDTAGKLYIADRNNHRVQVFTTGGAFQYVFGSQGTLNGQFRETLSVAVSDGARIVVADNRNDRVQVFRATATRQFGVGSTIVAGNSAGSATNSDLNSTGVFVSRGYNLVGISAGPSTGIVSGVNNDLVGTTVTPLNPQLSALASVNGSPPVHRLLLGSPAIDGGNPITSLTLDQLGNARIVDGNNDGLARADIGAVESPGTYLSGRVYLDNNSSGTLESGESGAAGRTVYVDLNNNAQFESGEPSAVTSSDLSSTPGVDEAGQYTIEGIAPGSSRLRIVPLSGFTTTSPVRVESGVAPTLSTRAAEGFTQRPGTSQVLTRVEHAAVAGQEVLFLGADATGSGLFAVRADGSLRALAVQGQTLAGGAALGDLLASAASYATDGTNRILLAPTSQGFYGLYVLDSSGMIRTLVDGSTTVPGLTVPFEATRLCFRLTSIVRRSGCLPRSSFSRRHHNRILFGQSRRKHLDTGRQWHAFAQRRRRAAVRSTDDSNRARERNLCVSQPQRRKQCLGHLSRHAASGSCGRRRSHDHNPQRRRKFVH